MKDNIQAGKPLAPNPLNNPKVRAFVFQLAVLTLVGVAGWALIDNTVTNLQRLNIASGFGFLDNTAGFGIVQTLVAYSEQSSYGRALLVGFLNTLLVAAIGIVIATVLGFTLGIARLSSNWLVAKLATVYIETVRNVPLLLQLFFWYFAVLRTLPLPRESHSLFDMFFVNNRGVFMPAVHVEGSSLLLVGVALFGTVVAIGLRYFIKSQDLPSGRLVLAGRLAPVLIFLLPLLVFFVAGMEFQVEVPALRGFGFRGGWSFIPELVALVLSLSIYTAAFIAENVRSGILSVSKGQSEAARALGLPPGRVLRLVVIPQALRVVIPPLTSQYLNLTKNSSLAVAIAYPDLVSVFSGTVLNQTGQAVEVIAITMTIYLSMSLLISLFMNWYNRHMALVER
ncbi:MAG: amino acid ABC transporter permease [Rhodobiaceae bacterium]|nr:MAG: amino acid ABC transporter permease [Rhodobiaceae bacterium]